MGNAEGVEKLFFELASDSRLSIMRELLKKNLKMQEIARRLNVTATEAFRQLERLSASLLVRRQPDGTFAIAEYGKLVLQLSSSFEFVYRNRNYFMTHEVMHLPIQFVNRLSELSKATLGMDTVENLNRGEHTFIEAEEYGWGIGEGTVPQRMGPIMTERLQKGVKLRFIIPENRASASASQPFTVRNLEVRSLPDLPALIVLSEKEGLICFPLIEGRMDYAGFYGKDPAFLNCVKDLFQYYWDKGTRV